jgi:hypothetical protein
VSDNWQRTRDAVREAQTVEDLCRILLANASFYYSAIELDHWLDGDLWAERLRELLTPEQPNP